MFHFVVNGEKTEVKVKDGEKASKPNDPVKEGYIFLGWYLGDEAYDFEKAVTTDLELIAKFEEEIKEYSVKFIIDSEETIDKVVPILVLVGAIIILMLLLSIFM